MCFNPRTHTGCDSVNFLSISCIYCVSIHAPTRGATCKTCLNMYITTFQSTHPHGVRPCAGGAIPVGMVFQSTHPHGVRPSSCSLPGFSIPFQSTHPHGVRLRKTKIKGKFHRFQSTHPHGVRRDDLTGYNSQQRVSIHAPTRGATFLLILVLNFSVLFQSTHPHGVRLTVRCGKCAECQFQSTHPHGVRHSAP